MDDFMESHSRHNHGLWKELFPTETIATDTTKDRVLVVDIGGGKGHDPLQFAKLHPEKKGALFCKISRMSSKKKMHSKARKRSYPASITTYLPSPSKALRVGLT